MRAFGQSLQTLKKPSSTVARLPKLKEPQPSEWTQLRENQILFTYLHLAPDPEQAKGLIKSGSTAIAYETVTDAHGGLPLLAPMSEVAGRLAIEAAGAALKRSAGGRGLLICGVPGVQLARIVVIGGGVVGTPRCTDGSGAWALSSPSSTVRFHGFASWMSCSKGRFVPGTRRCRREGLCGGRRYWRRSRSRRECAKTCQPWHVELDAQGSVMVNVAIDQGGCFETSRATTHAEPTYEVDGVIHYCVPNMPGAVPLTSSQALNNATLPLVWHSPIRDLQPCLKIPTCAQA
ncbi:alanine dehydrogenase [Bradyrhizobium sp. Arg816]|nr:alanine dehydrogenase [Bradyrhizobium sp. Arg816]MDI3567593.1 alanine dehydrogenase [Bradyrhizobium sp. Arg816]